MYVERIPNRNSPPAILLRESYRQGRQIKSARSPICRIGRRRRSMRCADVLRDEAVAPNRPQALRMRAQPAPRPCRGGAGHVAQAWARSGAVAGRSAA